MRGSPYLLLAVFLFWAAAIVGCAVRVQHQHKVVVGKADPNCRCWLRQGTRRCCHFDCRCKGKCKRCPKCCCGGCCK
jgi:hypothetical protein